MDFLYLLEKIRNPVFDFFFLLITHLGEETLFLAVAIVFFWCVNKREGYYIMITGLIGTIANQALKLAFKIPRPWVRDPAFTIVESARAEAGGYSFPSGHTQNAAGTLGAVGVFSKKRWVAVAALVIIALVAFSRMYLGVHTPTDVSVSLFIAAVLLLVLYPVFSTDEAFRKFMPLVSVAATIASIGLVAFTMLTPDASADAENLASARENASKLLGCTLCLMPAYYLDKHFIRFETGAPWYAQVMKTVIGLALVLLLKEGLKMPLIQLFGNVFVAGAVRYFAVVFFAAVLWPVSFRFFAKMRIAPLDRLFDKKG